MRFYRLALCLTLTLNILSCGKNQDYYAMEINAANETGKNLTVKLSAFQSSEKTYFLPTDTKKKFLHAGKESTQHYTKNSFWLQLIVFDPEHVELGNYEYSMVSGTYSDGGSVIWPDGHRGFDLLDLICNPDECTLNSQDISPSLVD